MDDSETADTHFGYVPERDLEHALAAGHRVQPHDLVGQVIGGSKVGDVITGNPATTNLGAGTSSGVFTLLNTKTVRVAFTLSDNFRRVVLAVPDVSVYLGSISTANHWPTDAYNMVTLPVSAMNDWGNTDNVNVVNRVVITNNTGSDQDLVVVNRWRIITNSSVSLSGQASRGVSQ